MTVTSLGTASVGTYAPAITPSLNAMLTTLNSQLIGITEASVQMGITPPTLAGSLASAVATVAQLTLSISLGVPDLSFQVSAAALQIAELEAEIAILVELADALGVVGLEGFLYQGTTSQFATELGPYTNGGVAGGGPGDTCTALVLAATSPAVIAAMSTVFGVP